MDKWWVLLIVFAGIVFRLLLLDAPISHDEFTQTKALLVSNEWGLEVLSEVAPLSNWSRIFVTALIGVQVWGLRFASLLAGLLTILFTYLAAKEAFGSRTAVWASILISLSALHTHVSTSIQFDGPFLTFYTILFLYFVTKYESSNSRAWLFAAGAAFGGVMLTKYTGFLVFPAVLAYRLFRTRDFWIVFKEAFIIGLVSCAVFSVFPLIAYLGSNPEFFWRPLLHGTRGYFSDSGSLVTLAIQFAYSAIWLGPLLLSGLFLSWRVKSKSHWMHYSFIALVLFFYIFVVKEPTRPVERYFSILIPSLCILTGDAVSKSKLNPRTFGIMLLGLLAFNFAVNSQGQMLPFYPKEAFVSSVLSLDWNFLVPFTGDQGPIGLYINFLVLAVAFALSVFAWFLSKQRLSMLLAVGLALNVFMIVELTAAPTSPNIAGISKDVTSFASRMPGPYVLYRDYALQYYLPGNVTVVTYRHWEHRAEELDLSDKTVAFVDFPRLNRESRLWKRISECEVVRTFEDKGRELGYVFSC